uniref:Uncharacterized protein n=1 Tax=Acrobeloides nanus TaxID=290746 RepID=A0A914DD44_9BILA
MDSNIKKELIEEIKQLDIKQEDDNEIVKPHQVSKFSVELHFGAVVDVDDREISISNENLSQTFFHRNGHSDRRYDVIKSKKSPKTTVILKGVQQVKDGNTFDFRDLTFEFDNFDKALPFINDLHSIHYTSQ